MQPPFDDDLAYRYVPYYRMGTGIPSYQCYWMYRMVATQRPLEEKMTLFWHHIFATSHSKMNRNPQMNQQLQLFGALPWATSGPSLLSFPRTRP